ncbi:hypothetical protein JQC91_08440 [Jannaschia sp. Os4]|uniref:hypothetical protein n=1 Tax=Jannaschia sp. Os4 TaxID=2807617 RepID=UPI0019395E88|nr:hypothetical protein [Jannaschia sp. Os4]MBM2576333.1 hypothetical protein [Jannaschia sp. Os4]
MAKKTTTDAQAGDRAGETAHGADAKDGLPSMLDWFRAAAWPVPDSAVAPASAGWRHRPVAEGMGTTLDSLAQMQAEMARFGARRMHRALEAQAAFQRCRTPADLLEARRAYVAGLSEDYADEWMRLVGYGMRCALGQPVPPPPAPEGERHATPL